MYLDDAVLREAIEQERLRRATLKFEGAPYHYWQVRGDSEPPAREYWCNHCVGYFGVPHHYQPDDEHLCRNIASAFARNPQCACIDCTVVTELLAHTAPSS